ncbi:MAG: HIT family protein [Gammaproteobacteria bacterium]|nr:HIT family protein [Gammaproteobacteria bacterium]
MERSTSKDNAKSACLFCNIPTERIIEENELAYVIEDNFPVTEKHTLVIPKRHVSSYFELTEEEVIACDSLLEKNKDRILITDSSISGFNIGINIGEDAGQTIFHCHIHLIPRRKGDVINPKGGVRGVIPSKQSY